MANNPTNIPGFFYDEEKGKYFPNHMKASYEAKRKLQISENATKKAKESDEAFILEILNSTDLNRVWPKITVPIKFDSTIQTIDRININEFNWGGKVKIDKDEGVYFRIVHHEGDITIQHVALSDEGCENVIHEFSCACKYPPQDFGVIPMKNNDNHSFIYYYIVKVSPAYQNDRHYIYVIMPNNYLNSALATYSYGPVELFQDYFKIATFIVEDSFGYSVVFSEDKKSLVFKTQGSLMDLRFDEKHVELEGFSKDLDFIFEVPELGIAKVYVGGRITFSEPQYQCFKDIRLYHSSAKWLHYYKFNLYVLTYHGDLILLRHHEVEATQIPLFNVKDLSDLPRNQFRFEDLIVEASKSILMFGFRGGNEILMINLNNPTKIMKRIPVQKKIESFKLSSNYKNLYIQNKSNTL